MENYAKPKLASLLEKFLPLVLFFEFRFAVISTALRFITFIDIVQGMIWGIKTAIISIGCFFIFVLS